MVVSFIFKPVANPSQLAAVAMFLSLGTTLFATALIIYRIRDLSRDIDSTSSSGRYTFIIQALVESGALYEAALVVGCISLSIKNHETTGPNGQGTIFWVSLATPMAVSI